MATAHRMRKHSPASFQNAACAGKLKELCGGPLCAVLAATSLTIVKGNGALGQSARSTRQNISEWNVYAYRQSTDGSIKHLSVIGIIS